VEFRKKIISDDLYTMEFLLHAIHISFRNCERVVEKRKPHRPDRDVPSVSAQKRQKEILRATSLQMRPQRRQDTIASILQHYTYLFKAAYMWPRQKINKRTTRPRLNREQGNARITRKLAASRITAIQ
jgi:hypothetical protein